MANGFVIKLRSNTPRQLLQKLSPAFFVTLPSLCYVIFGRGKKQILRPGANADTIRSTIALTVAHAHSLLEETRRHLHVTAPAMTCGV